MANRNLARVGLGAAAWRCSSTANTSFGVISSSLTRFLGQRSLAGMSYPLLGWPATAAAAGAVLGSWFMTDKLKGPQVKIVIGVILLGIPVKMAWGLV